jgi:maleylpyruvate isomerase
VPDTAQQKGDANTVAKNLRSLTGDIGVMERESGMAMATVASLREDELGKPTRCKGWTRAHVIAHLARDADAMTNLTTWAVTGRETPAYESREKRDADIEAAAKLSAAKLAGALEQADARLLEAVRTLKDGVKVETLPTLFTGEINVFALPALRTTELIVHHNDLDTTWEWHEADPDATLDAIEVCVRRLQANNDSPGLQIIAREGEEWTVGDGSHRIEGYYEALLPFLAREQVDEGLRYEGELPSLPPW